MVNRLMISPAETPQRHLHRLARARRILLLGVTTLATIIPTSFLIASPSASAASNANFKGTWKVSGGYLGFTIKSENLHTGVCAGSTAEAQYHLIACRVTGHKYSFTITEGSYRSHNTGTFSGNRAVGRFSDSNGTIVTYTAVK